MWQAELSSFRYSILRKPAVEYIAPDDFTRLYGATISVGTLKDIHMFLGHPGVTRLMHFVRSKNLNYSLDEVCKVCSECKKCFLLKPNFYWKLDKSLIKAFQL